MNVSGSPRTKRFGSARLPETGDCQGNCRRYANGRRQQASKTFLFNRFERRRLAARPSSSGQIEKPHAVTASGLLFRA